MYTTHSNPSYYFFAFLTVVERQHRLLNCIPQSGTCRVLLFLTDGADLMIFVVDELKISSPRFEIRLLGSILKDLTTIPLL